VANHDLWYYGESMFCGIIEKPCFFRLL